MTKNLDRWMRHSHWMRRCLRLAVMTVPRWKTHATTPPTMMGPQVMRTPRLIPAPRMTMGRLKTVPPPRRTVGKRMKRAAMTREATPGRMMAQHWNWSGLRNRCHPTKTGRWHPGCLGLLRLRCHPRCRWNQRLGGSQMLRACLQQEWANACELPPGGEGRQHTTAWTAAGVPERRKAFPQAARACHRGTHEHLFLQPGLRHRPPLF